MADNEDQTPSNVDDLRWTIAQGIDTDPYSSTRDNDAAHDALRALCEHVARLTAALDWVRDDRGRLAHWLDEVDLKAQHALSAALTALPRSSTARDAVVTAWDALDTLRDCLRAARAARTQPEGSNE